MFLDRDTGNFDEDRVRQVAIDLRPNLRHGLSPRESRSMLQACTAGMMMVDVREVESELATLGILRMILGPLTDQVADSIRQYRIAPYVTVLNASAVASRVHGNKDLARFAEEMKKLLAAGPRPARVVKSKPVGARTSTVDVPPVKEH